MILQDLPQTSKYVNYTQRLQCSSFLVVTYFLLRDSNILPQKELPLSPWAPTLGCLELWGWSLGSKLRSLGVIALRVPVPKQHACVGDPR